MFIIWKRNKIVFNKEYKLKIYDLSDWTVREKFNIMNIWDSVVFFPIKEDIDWYVWEIEGIEKDWLFPKEMLEFISVEIL